MKFGLSRGLARRCRTLAFAPLEAFIHRAAFAALSSPLRAGRRRRERR
jgi:hypothetical protein